MITIIAPSRYKIHKKILSAQTQEYLRKLGATDKTGATIVFVGKRKMTAIAAKYKNEYKTKFFSHRKLV